MLIKELYTKGTKVWLADPVNVWQCATILEDFKDQKELNVQLENGREVKVKLKSTEDLPPLRNPEVLIGENDLTSLSYLHEPAVLHNLQVRFLERNHIYTYCGIVLVAFNPYQKLPIYDNGTIRAYSGQDMSSMDPHIFAIAEEAFKRMTRFEENQSIIVSGESGAGKTVSAKYAMRYFATVCGAEDETQIEKRVLATNPIMEAIGNAKTTRNDNSSRFGKYIEIGFGRSEHIQGANMRTYLLEKSRVVFQASEERNYHVFYQLCSVADDEAFKQYHLDSSDEFYYTNQGGASSVNSISDSEDFLNFCQALSVLGLNPMKQSQIFRILAGILHLGNIQLREDEKTGESSFVPEKDRHMAIAAKLFGVDQEQLRFWLCNKKMITVNETLSVPLTVSQAAFSRDALAKHIYSSLFLWIVSQLNKSLSPSSKRTRFIGVLDIYGFETFENNSFEQFCINYANEKLQQQFCLHVFKLEQEEYVREQIEWSFIDFHDNQPCIDLIENKLGILDLLDEECKMVNGSDANWCRKLYDRHLKNAHFAKPRLSQVSFVVRHFADDVEYQTPGFLEKNRDRVLEEHIKIFKASEYELIAEMFQDQQQQQQQQSNKMSQGRPVPIRAGGGKETSRSFQQIKMQSKTVGSQFSESLNLLMETLFSTTPHYVRCIKPNDSKLPFTFDPIRTVQQLRACGVLETIRISAAGYPSRWTYADFFKRYRVLATSKDIVKPDVKKTCENLLCNLIKEKDRFQFGKTKIFFRAGQVAYLEKLRSEKLRRCSVLMQKVVRGWLARRRYRKIQTMVRKIQKFGRGVLARRKANLLRRSRAATKIRAFWLGHRQRRKYLKMRRSLILIQSCARAMLGKKNFAKRHRAQRVATIQRCIRGWLCRRKYKMVVRGVTKMQGLVRIMIAKRKLKLLKVEAKDVYLVKTKGLENKIIELQQKLDDKAREVVVLKEDQEFNAELKVEVQKLRGAKESTFYMAGQVSDLERRLLELTSQLEEATKEKERILHEKEAVRKEKDDIINHLNNERLMLKEQLETLTQELKAHMENQEDATKKRIEEATASLNHEIELERTNHQRLIKEHNRLQQRLDNLQSDSSMYLGTPRSKRHRRTPSNLSEFSIESESSIGDKNDLDSGYGYTKKKDQTPFDETDMPRASESIYPLEKKDISLAVRLQAKLKELEKENRKYRDDINRRDFPCQDVIFNLSNLPLANVFEAFKIQEQEIENASLRNQLSRLQKVLTESASNYDVKGGKTKQLYDHFEALKEELKFKHNEVARLKTLLFKYQQLVEQNNNAANNNNSGNYSEVASNNNNGAGPSPVSYNSAPLNEDGELNVAYESQKKLNQLLEAELQRLNEISILRDQDLQNQIENLNKENKKQQKIIEENLEASADSKMESSILFEISKISSENLNLHGYVNSLQDMNKKLRKAVRIYSKRLKGTEVNEANMELERELAMDSSMPLVKYHQQREWMGMLEFKKEDEPLLMRNLILDLRPEMMLKETPQLPSFLLLMCIRHTDYMNDDEKVRSLLTNSINCIKKVVKKSSNDLGRVSAWLSNSVSLLNNLKQYSGEKTFQPENTAKQNEQCLKNFDLSEYRQILNDLAVWIYQVAIKYAESKLQNIIVGAILEKESVAGCTTGKPVGMRQTSTVADESDSRREFSPDDLFKILNEVLQNLSAHNVQFDVVRQIFKQIFFFICATALNTLLLRKDLCHWMKAVQIRYNVTQLEQWVRDNKLNEGGAVEEPLLPLIQATQLLQARKTEADVDGICDVCSKLNMSQIVKILNLYTPVNEFEERVPMSFIRKVQEKMSSSTSSSSSTSTTGGGGGGYGADAEAGQQPLMLDTKFTYAVSFDFRPSTVAVERLNPPLSWGLGFLKKL